MGTGFVSHTELVDGEGRRAAFLSFWSASTNGEAGLGVGLVLLRVFPVFFLVRVVEGGKDGGKGSVMALGRGGLFVGDRAFFFGVSLFCEMESGFSEMFPSVEQETWLLACLAG